MLLTGSNSFAIVILLGVIVNRIDDRCRFGRSKGENSLSSLRVDFSGVVINDFHTHSYSGGNRPVVRQYGRWPTLSIEWPASQNNRHFAPRFPISGFRLLTLVVSA
jgi:hypothetical protein